MSRTMTIWSTTAGLTAADGLPANARSIVWQFRHADGHVPRDPAGKVRVGTDPACDVVAGRPYDLPHDRMPEGATCVEALAKAKPDGFGAVLGRSPPLRLTRPPPAPETRTIPRGDVQALREAGRKGGEYMLSPGVYDLGATAIRVDRPLTLTLTGTDDTTIRLASARSSSTGALEVRSSVTLRGLAFDAPERCYGVRLRSGVATLESCVTGGPGGLAFQDGGTLRLTDCRQETIASHYVVYADGGKSLTLTRCVFGLGSRHESLVRTHGVAVTIEGGTFVQPAKLADGRKPTKEAAIRVMTGPGGVLRDLSGRGVISVGPLAEGDGGGDPAKHPPGTRRRLEALRSRLGPVRVHAEDWEGKIDVQSGCAGATVGGSWRSGGGAADALGRIAHVKPEYPPPRWRSPGDPPVRPVTPLTVEPGTTLDGVEA